MNSIRELHDYTRGHCVYTRAIQAHTRENECYPRAPWLYERHLRLYEREWSLFERASFSSVKKTDKCSHLSVFFIYLFIYIFPSFGCFHTRTKGPSFSVSITNEPLEYLSAGRNEFTSIVSWPFSASIIIWSFFSTNNTSNTR